MPNNIAPAINEEGTVYLICLASSIAHSRHYIGWTGKDLKYRIAHHKAGRGAKFLAEANRRGIAYEVVRTWPGSGDLERRLKNLKNAASLCPHCCKEYLKHGTFNHDKKK